MPDVVWIASYPKSGNTWLRFLLDGYFFGPADDWKHVSRVVIELDDLLRRMNEAGESEEWILEQVRSFRRTLALPPDFPAHDFFFKSHFALTPAHPMLARTRAAIHIIRNPRDVLLSGKNFADLVGRRDAQDAARYVRTFIQRGGDPHWINRGYGTWAQHAESWLSGTPFPLLRLRYEDLRREPAEGLEQVLRFLGLAPDRARVERAVEAASLDRMRSLEMGARQQGVLPGADRPVFFINQGRTGQRLDDLAPGLDAEFDGAFGEAMRRFGYGG